ncbi:hypothetical protein [Modestobacter sp. KNN46-3]|uniref:hypothetical protein n=1 Tax=Modestobacter sp. KNN46-3 TaxID=2711218 RepID=UPI0013DF099F|nr:hypothetical protein [Modestobacter sp. KNN46-3]
MSADGHEQTMAELNEQLRQQELEQLTTLMRAAGLSPEAFWPPTAAPGDAAGDA